MLSVRKNKEVNFLVEWTLENLNFFLKMLTPLKLNILAARVVVSQRQDFSLYLTGNNRQELEGLDKLKGNYRVEEVKYKAERREGTNLREEKVVKLSEEEWQHELSSMTIREQREMEKFLRESGER